eukprot:scaffold47982_cov56-Phaeocystis_antarctica.AAC.2
MERRISPLPSCYRSSSPAQEGHCLCKEISTRHPIRQNVTASDLVVAQNESASGLGREKARRAQRRARAQRLPKAFKSLGRAARQLLPSSCLGRAAPASGGPLKLGRGNRVAASVRPQARNRFARQEPPAAAARPPQHPFGLEVVAASPPRGCWRGSCRGPAGSRPAAGRLLRQEPGSNRTTAPLQGVKSLPTSHSCV